MENIENIKRHQALQKANVVTGMTQREKEAWNDLSLLQHEE